MGKNRLIQNVILLLRPAHYIKNVFLFLPLFFSAQITHPDLLFQAALAFVAFCLVASSVYVFNDIVDAPEDRNHPDNRIRPVAARSVSVGQAALLDAVLTFAGLVVSLLVGFKVFVVILLYKILNVFYTLILKKIAILDIMILSLGFVLRLYAGAFATGVVLTEWIILMTYLLALLIAMGKRRNDVLVFEREDIVLRSAVKGYNSQFLNYAMILLSSVIVVSYMMYTVSPEVRLRLGTDYLFVTVFWVIAAILRYLQLLFVNGAGEPPVKLLMKDHPLKIILLAWMLNFLYFIYMSGQ